jgi:DNA polymerase-3 subunit alpha
MLNNHSYYSLRYGTVSPDEVLSLRADGDWEYFALTDINCTSGLIDYARICSKKNLPCAIGIDFRNGAEQMFVSIAKNNEGFYEINQFLSAHLHEEKEYESVAPAWQNCFVIYPFKRTLQKDAVPNELRENEYIGIRLQDIPRLRFSSWAKQPHKLVLMQTMSFRHKRDFNAHRLLRAIDNNTLLSKLPKTEEGSPEEVYMSKQQVLEKLEEYSFLFTQSEDLLKQCSIDFDFAQLHGHKNQQSYTGNEERDYQLLIDLCSQGLNYRYPELANMAYELHYEKLEQLKEHDNEILKRIGKELGIIREKGFVSYFLINWDITRYAREKGYFYVGRGSGANSVVAYLLCITDVDPIELDLYFERFINLFRQNPPDFDIDFSWKEREDITQYIFQRFPNAALLGAFVTFQYSAVVRELGKVFGLPKHEIDMLSDGKFKADQLDSMHQLVLYYSRFLHDFPNYVSIHSCGVLITEKPTHYYGATFMPPKGFATVQFDMHQAEDIGINKLDILSQRGLSKIKETLDIIAYNQPDAPEIDIHNVKQFKQDERCNYLLQTAQAIGCFYVESPAMRMLLTKLRTHNYIGLVAASSVIRPGVASSGMMRAFILRERQPERRLDAPQALLDLMPETYGVMVYQEDVIKVAHYYAGLSLGEADVLRRGMSGKFRGREEFERAALRFYEGALEQGHHPDMVREVWRQVESFAGYAFAKGHSASYAVESYQCLFLKAYYPLEYMVACINNYGGFYKTEFYVHEARMHGASVEGPCVNTSLNEAVILGNTIVMGFQFIKSLEQQVVAELLKARCDGPFASLDDFIDRVPISLEQCVLLARMNAFRFTGIPKKELLWQIHFRLHHQKPEVHTPLLFKPNHVNLALPPLEHHWLEDAYDELELLGFTLCNPFHLLAEEVEQENFASEFKNKIGQTVATIGYLVTLKPTRTSNGKAMFFGTFIDRHGHFIDSVHFPPAAEKHPVSGWGLFLLVGKVMEEFDAISLEVEYVRRLKLLSDPRLEDTPAHPALMRKNHGTDKWMGRYFRVGE